MGPGETAPFLLVVNPKAGRGKAARKLPSLLRALEERGAAFTVARTEGPGHASELVREALRAGTAGVAVVGGDGTLNEATHGFFDEEGEPIAPDRWLAPLPCGTGGDFRRTLGQKLEIEAMVTRMLWAKPRPIDAGWATFLGHEGEPRARAFLNISSFGMGGVVDRIAAAAPSWMGSAVYGYASFMASFEYREPRPVRVRLDGERERVVQVLSYVVANGRYFGGGMHVAPKAELDDGLFDIVSIEGIKPLGSLPLLAQIYAGSHLGSEAIVFERAQRIEAEPLDAEPVLIDLDGEAPGRLPLTFEIRPKALHIRG